MQDKEVEYVEAVAMYRFYHDYRMKILNYTMTFNGVLLAVTIQYIANSMGRIMLSIFAILTTLVMLAFERRTINFANKIIGLISNLESNLDYSTMSSILEYSRSSGIPQKIFVWILYVLIIVIWIIIVISSLYRWI